MGDFFKSVKFKVIVFLIAAFAVFALLSVGSSKSEFFGSQALKTVLNPVMEVSNSISAKVTDTLDTFSNAKDYKAENEQLKEQISELNGRLVEYYDMKSELSDLKDFMGIKENNEDYTTSPPCTIISRNTNDPNSTFVIDRGSNSDISLYDPVVTADGLVGIITDVADTYSTVSTIFSPKVSVGAICVETRDTGIVEGNLTYSKDGKCKMIYIDKENTISEGDLIITSGNSGEFPQGYVIGNVEICGTEESGLNAYAVVKPTVDIENLTSVMVITNFDGQGESDEN